MVDAITDEHVRLVTRLAKDATVSEPSQLPIKDILVIIPLPTVFLRGKTLVMTATAKYLIEYTSLSFIRYHADSSIFSPSMQRAILGELYHGPAKKIPKMLAGPKHVLVPLSSPDHRNTYWVGAHHLKEHKIQRVAKKRKMTAQFQGDIGLTLPTTHDTAFFTEILGAAKLLMDVMNQLNRISSGEFPYVADSKNKHEVLVDHAMARKLQQAASNRIRYQGAKQVVGDDDFMLQSFSMSDRNPDSV